MKIDELPISDCKAAMDFLGDRIKERVHYLKINNLEIESDLAYISLERLHSKIHNNLFSKIRKLGYGKD